MDATYKVLVQLARLEMFSCVGNKSIDLKGWIANQNYHVESVSSSSNFSLRAADKAHLINALANDCNRMAIAAVECVCGIKEDTILKKSGAWGIIRLYYACFFAAHSILRMYGISCSQLDRPHVKKIYESAKLVGKEGDLTKLEKGFYVITIDKAFQFVSLNKCKDTHRDTWWQFLNLLNILIVDSELTTALMKHKIEAIDLLTKIKNGITRAQCIDKGNWLSKFRNSVNYQHSHGVWYPYESRAVAVSYVKNISEQWKISVDVCPDIEKHNDIETFFEVGLIIIRLFRELIVSCARKTSSVNQIFSNGSLRLLNTLKAA